MMKNNLVYLLVLVTMAVALSACDPSEPPGSGGTDGGDLTAIPYNPQAYTIRKPATFPPVPVPAANPMTVAGVQLGRRLFYDPILSGDSSKSCSSCHLPQGSFTDNEALSLGIDGIAGRRSAMSLLDIAYVPANKGLFWDGRASNLEDQALLPVEDELELHAIWPNVVERLKTHPDYPTWFRQAFGIADRGEITKELAARALAQFERTLISSGNSRYDQWQRGEGDLTDEEIDGYFMVVLQGGGVSGLPDAQCFHCHGNETMLSSNSFFNNGLDSVGTLEEFKDFGLGERTGLRLDKGKFRAPGLRNIAMSAPYMHDGRFTTLEQVVAQYSDNGFGVENEDPFIRQVGFPLGNGKYSGLTLAQQQNIVAFLHTLTDPDFVNNPDHQNPFD